MSIGGIGVGAAAAALVVWATALADVDVREVNDLGLVSVLPPAAFIAMGGVALVFAWLLGRATPSHVAIAAQVVALVVMLYGAPSVIEDATRFHVSWRHVGVTDYIIRTGSVDPGIDAYFNWPGFFVFTAFIAELAGFESLLVMTKWNAVFFNLLYLGPLFLLARAATRDWRLAWLAVWIFAVANWIGQDYFAPQALAYFLHLVVVAIVAAAFLSARPLPLWVARTLRRLRPPVRGAEHGATEMQDEGDGERRPHVRLALLAIAVLIFAAVVPTHQLTPFVTLTGIAILVLFNRCWARRLPLVMLVLLGTWIVFMAESYLAGHRDELISHIGDVEQNLHANVGSRLAGSDEHLAVVYTRLGMTGFLWLLAVAGGIRAYRAGRRDVGYAVLGGSPFLVLALQPYGGEILLRVFLFSLPFVAFFVASLFYPRAHYGRARRTTVAVAVLSTALLGGSLVARYGNERMDYFTTDEVAAVASLYELAPPGSVLVAGSVSLPWKYRDYEKYDYEVLTELPAWDTMLTPSPRPALVVRAAATMMHAARGPAFVIITRSQKAEVELRGTGPVGALTEIERVLDASTSFRLVYRNADATIYEFVSSAEERA